jgi:phosphoribosyl 1,2-cyclic phosphate phosphodiesterase
MRRHVTILGCGSSGGVPRVGQGWGECDPTNPRNRRRRCSILLEQIDGSDSTIVLVDTSPDLRDQLLSAEVERIDAIVYTHDHADHTHGVDDVRPLVIHNRRRIDAFMDETTARGMVERFGYVFRTPHGSDYAPILSERRIESGVAFVIGGAGGQMNVTPFRLVHGGVDALGLRVGGMAYTPDVSAVPPEALDHLVGLDLWIIDALRVRPHPSHLSLDEALAWIERLAPKRAVLTNLHTDLDYAALAARLPAHIEPAYDGLKLEF